MSNQPEFQVWEMIRKGRGQSTLRLRTPDPSAAQTCAEELLTAPLNTKNYVYIHYWPADPNLLPSTVWDSIEGWHQATDLRNVIRDLIRRA